MTAPIFIMGAHRSGTTWLQQLMVDTGCFDYVSAYHVIRYEELRDDPVDPTAASGYRELGEAFRRLNLQTRLLDDVIVSPDLPEEYGFILHNAGAGNTITRRNLPLLRQICRRVRRPGAERPIVLKNPWDADNFLFIRKLIPDARFVFIHRHPLRVVSSALKAARVALGSRGEYMTMLSREYGPLFDGSLLHTVRLRMHRMTLSPRLGLGVRLVTSRITEPQRAFARDIDRLRKECYVSLRYEDLCDRPREELARVLAFVGVDPAHADSLRTPAKPRGGEVLPEVRRYAHVVERRLARYMDLLDYPPSPGS